MDIQSINPHQIRCINYTEGAERILVETVYEQFRIESDIPEIVYWLRMFVNFLQFTYKGATVIINPEYIQNLIITKGIVWVGFTDGVAVSTGHSPEAVFNYIIDMIHRDRSQGRGSRLVWMAHYLKGWVK